MLRSIRSLKQSPGAVSRKLVLVVAENCEGFHATHKRAALRFNLTIVVSIPFPCNVHSLKDSIVFCRVFSLLDH